MFAGLSIVLCKRVLNFGGLKSKGALFKLCSGAPRSLATPLVGINVHITQDLKKVEFRVHKDMHYDCQIMKAIFACVLKCYFLCLLF